MLFKWLFTLLAIIWLIQAVRPYFDGSTGIKDASPPTPDPPPPPREKPRPPDENDYIDYEEIK